MDGRIDSDEARESVVALVDRRIDSDEARESVVTLTGFWLGADGYAAGNAWSGSSPATGVPSALSASPGSSASSR